MWHGRFTTPTADLLLRYSESISFDWRAAFDDSVGTMLRASLLNDVASYV